MSARPPVRVVVAGGGTAGWITAAALVRQLRSSVDVTLIESDEIGTVGVGEATIPTARTFHELLRIDEQAFMAATQATIKLGIAFENWGAVGDRYIHSFGTAPLETVAAGFQHFWLQARSKGDAHPLADYYPEYLAAEAGVFGKTGRPPLNYAYHLDATLYARFLRTLAESEGAKRVEGRILAVTRDGTSGDISELRLSGDRTVAGDLFIDCTGFRALLSGDTMGCGFEDWNHWLPTDGAWAVQTQSVSPPVPYTRAIAHGAGWRWRIPLQHRVGNGLVFASGFIEPDAAREQLLASLDGSPLTEPRVIRYRAGRRKDVWTGNCIALGLSSGFVEPLESTSIHLFMIGVTRLVQQFPFGGITPALRARYNRMAKAELERVRDFVILHYRLTQRDDTPFWNHCRTMEIPDTLAERIALFEEQAHCWQEAEDLFRTDSWLQVMLGQGVSPRSWHALPALMEGRLRPAMERARMQAKAALAGLPNHYAFLADYCPAQPIS